MNITQLHIRELIIHTSTHTQRFHQYKIEIHNRIFAIRFLSYGKITWLGYTLLLCANQKKKKEE